MATGISEINKTVGLILGRADVKPSDRLYEDLGAESVDVLNIIATIEEMYGIAIDDANLPSMRTIADLQDVVRRMVVQP